MATFSTLRNFQQNSSAVLAQARENDGLAYLTSRGKPVAIIMPVSTDNAEAISVEIKRQRFAAAFRTAQSDISKSDEKFTSKDLSQLISNTRKARKR